MKQPKKRKKMREGKGMADRPHKLLHVPNSISKKSNKPINSNASYVSRRGSSYGRSVCIGCHGSHTIIPLAFGIRQQRGSPH